ncbi:type IV pilus assembly protein PilC [Methylohalomonas lacus]|uniref:Type IV pilus assembly protein PilC n=1 Tax=Methylohalomonas lacus TaxID=398773 RepID=A0AAE3HMH8_9GAMM|nr:type II secretion system F family protein [Methylohalomonas lacus]MCS3903869.1 type IV pilus assembly protein PilC [Methylohalomonas lacus]
MAEAAKSVMFVWEGTDKSGKRVKGEMTGTSDSLVKAVLRRQGINPLKVKKKPKPLFGGGRKKITTKDITVFSRQLATMMSAGVPLVQAFEIVGRGHENVAMQELILAIKGDVESGGTLAEALAKHPRHFSELYVNLVAAGEQAGILETLLHKIATYLEKTETLKGKIKKALFYPLAVIVVAFIVTAILLIFVIPQFEELFKGFGADLPAPTQFVLYLSAVFQKWWWAIALGIGGTIWAIIESRRRFRSVARFIDRALLKLPIIGDILYKAAVARFARTLSTMFAAGTPLVEAMVSVAGASGNIVFYNAIMEMRDEISTGTQLQVAMRESQLFPNMVVQMVAIGEEAGSLDQMLAKVADFYEEEVDNAVDSLSSLLEPMIMAFLGVIIGGLVVSMYLPIFKMGQVV